MKRFKTLLLVTAVLCVTFFCYAEDKPDAMTSTATQVTGTIAHVDVQARTITLRIKKEGKEQTVIYTFTAQTEFQKGSARIQPEDLKDGNQVTVKTDVNKVITSLRLEEAMIEKQQ